MSPSFEFALGANGSDAGGLSFDSWMFSRFGWCRWIGADGVSVKVAIDALPDVLFVCGAGVADVLICFGPVTGLSTCWTGAAAAANFLCLHDAGH